MQCAMHGIFAGAAHLHVASLKLDLALPAFCCDVLHTDVAYWANDTRADTNYCHISTQHVAALIIISQRHGVTQMAGRNMPDT